MSELPNWDNIVVPQRHPTGCIPTGYEWLVRYLGIQGVNLATFQEDFDLGNENSFASVAERINSRYPYINIEIRDFSQGLEKIRAIRTHIENATPFLISLALWGTSGWHIMPIVHIGGQRIGMIHHANERGNVTWGFPIQEVIWRHDNMQGGKDIAWIQTSSYGSQHISASH